MTEPSSTSVFTALGLHHASSNRENRDTGSPKQQFESILDEIASWPSVQISFDDGNKSDVEFGLPALVERGLTATFFVLAGRLDSVGSLDPGDIVDLCSAGMTVGTHGMNHRSWRGMDAETRHRELSDARERIAEIAGRSVDQAALPLGQYDRRLLVASPATGLSSLCTPAIGAWHGRGVGSSLGSVSAPTTRHNPCGRP